MKTTLTAALLLATGSLLIAPAAQASDDRVPAQVTVKDIPARFLTATERTLLTDLGLTAGDTVPLQWIKGPDCRNSQPLRDRAHCPHVSVDGQPVPIPESFAAVVPFGADTPSGDSTYPAFRRFFGYDGPDYYVEGLGPYDRDPNLAGAKFAPIPTLVWESDQRVEKGGVTFVRVAWGTEEAWVQAKVLAEPHAPEPTGDEPTSEPTGDPTAEPVAEAAGSTETDATTTEDEGGGLPWLLLAGVAGVLLASGAWIGLARRKPTAPDAEDF